MRIAAVAAGLALLVLGCAEAPAPQVAVSGSATALRELAGEWRGEYWSAESGRRGTIRFTLSAQADGSATGEVTMVAEPRGRGGQAPPVVEALPIRFVAATDGWVRGALEPYDDPVCGCSLSTTFTGRWRGERIRGEFTSRGGGGHPTQAGRWRVKRLRTAVSGS